MPFQETHHPTCPWVEQLGPSVRLVRASSSQKSHLGLPHDAHHWTHLFGQTPPTYEWYRSPSQCVALLCLFDLNSSLSKVEVILVAFETTSRGM